MSSPPPTLPPQSSILYASPCSSIFVLDMPRSIALAQGTPSHPTTRQLISRRPLDVPYPELEPKSERARANVQRRGQGVLKGDEVYVKLVREALEHVREGFGGELCGERVVESESVVRARRRPKRKAEDVLDEDEIETKTASAPATPQSFLSTLLARLALPFPSPSTAPTVVHSSGPPTSLTPILTNPHAHPLPITIHLPSYSIPSTTYTLPPHATALLTHLPLPSPALAPSTPNGFHLTLLDPPWPNRSAARAAAYSRATSLADARTLLDALAPDLAAHGRQDGKGFLAVWVTNSKGVREAVLGRRGRDGVARGGWLQEVMGMEVVEEWVWVKVARDGQPVTALEGVWRRPYEVLVIARARESSSPEHMPSSNYDDDGAVRTAEEGVRRRVILAVPDLHSRKPCLKELFERLLLPERYEALEVFARYMVSGWHSWGNEVLLFNGDECWDDGGREAAEPRGHSVEHNESGLDIAAPNR